MERIKKYVLEQVATKKLDHKEAELMLRELLSKGVNVETDIAIIGMSGKYADSSNLNEYWDVLINKKNCIRDYDEQRIQDGDHLLDIPFYQEIMLGYPISRENVRYFKSGFLKDGIDKFDGGFFGIPPREAKYIEPAHRIFLETAWEAIEDAGYGGEKIYGTNTGVFVGRDNTVVTLYKHITKKDPMHLTGSWAGILASRLSYIFNLSGPSLMLDTACSSGLVSLHMACKALRNNECKMAIAGGIHVSYSAAIPPEGEKTIMDLGMVESEDFIARPFDDKANGTVWGEGVGVVFLKPLSKALEDGDNIHAIIKGSAINNDGASNGITAPSAAAQEQVILDAWKDAQINPETISYIEAHGTATNLGDPIEIKGMTSAFRHHTNKNQFCGIGSSKGYIGHTVAASGLASLMKVVLSLKNNVMLPSSNFNEPNHFINFGESPVYVNDRLKPWVKESTPRRAGISSFGFSGTNCHVVIEEAPELKKQNNNASDIPNVLMLSGRNDKVLRELVNNYKAFLETGVEFDIQDACYTVNTGRGQYASRLIFIVKDLEDLKNKIAKVNDTEFKDLSEKDIFYGTHKVVVDNKEVKDPDEIGESEKRQISKLADEKVDMLIMSRNNSNELAEEICKLFVIGADVKWDKLYVGQKRRRVSLPVYPLEKLRVWAEPMISSYKDALISNKKEYKHPLLDRCIVDTFDSAVFSTIVSVDTHWVLKEHIFLGNYLMPGIAYLEIAREACSKVYTDCKLELKDVIFPVPLIVEEKEVKEIHTIVRKKQGYLEFSITSKINSTGFEGDDVWVVHAEGKVNRLDEAECPQTDIQEIFSRCSGTIPPDDFVVPGKKHIEMNFIFGLRWQNIFKRSHGEVEELVELKLKDECLGDTEEFVLHPAQLDNAMNATLLHIKYETYLPFSYRSLKVHAPLTGHIYSVIKRKNELNTGLETISFDVIMIDKDGKVLVEVEHYTIKKVNASEMENIKSRLANRNAFYGIKWAEKQAADITQHQITGCTVVFKGNAALSNKVYGSIKDICKDIIEVSLGDSYNKNDNNKFTIRLVKEDLEKLFDEIKERKITKIVHMLSLSDEAEIVDMEKLNSSQQAGVQSLFHMIKAVLSSKIKGNIDIAIISDNVNQVTGNETNIKPHNASLLGLSRVIEQEYSNLKCRSIDIDEFTNSYDIVYELMLEGSTKTVAFRNGKRYIAELDRIKVDLKVENRIEVRQNGVYAITGGTGGLGLEIAKYLAEKNNTNIILINRSKFPESSEWDDILTQESNPRLCSKIQAIREIQEMGSNVVCVSGDMTDADEADKIISNIRKNYGSINGIVHCAGLAGDGFIINKDEKVFNSVLEPKVKGTWILDNAAKQDDLDFFVLFSSMSTLHNFAGQGDYTAANSYLDSYAAYRNKQGKRTIAINWPGWKETGMAADHNKVSDEADDMLLFKSIPTVRAIESFDTILNSGLTNLAPGDINYRILSESPEQFSFELSQQMQKAIARKMSQAGGANNAKLGMKEMKEISIKGKGDGTYNETEQVIARIFAGILGMDEIDVYVSFHEMGGDSILATHLVKEIDRVYPGVVDITDIFTYSSVERMAKYINEKTGVIKVEEVIEQSETKQEEENLKDMFESMLQDEA